MRSQAPYAKANWAYLYLNGEWLGTSTAHYTYYNGPGMVDLTGGRVVTLEASAGDHIDLRATEMGGSFFYINFCVEFIAKM